MLNTLWALLFTKIKWEVEKKGFWNSVWKYWEMENKTIPSKETSVEGYSFLKYNTKCCLSEGELNMIIV